MQKFSNIDDESIIVEKDNISYTRLIEKLSIEVNNEEYVSSDITIVADKTFENSLNNYITEKYRSEMIKILENVKLGFYRKDISILDDYIDSFKNNKE